MAATLGALAYSLATIVMAFAAALAPAGNALFLALMLLAAIVAISLWREALGLGD